MTSIRSTRTGPSPASVVAPADDDVVAIEEAEKAGGGKSDIPIRKKRKIPAPPAPAAATSSSSSSDEPAEAAAASAKKEEKKKKKAATHQQWTERTPLVRLWDPTSLAAANDEVGRRPFVVISWNVAGLRALVKNRPDALPDLVRRYDADVLCLQETKLQVENMNDPRLGLREYFEERMGGYDCHWSYSVERKGYSGTAMFIRRGGGVVGLDRGGGESSMKGKKKQAKLGAFFGSAESSDGGGGKRGVDGSSNAVDVPISHLRPVNVETELGLPEHDAEGRIITAEFPLFYLTNVYVPNSGQKLDRLGYRTERWDVDFLAMMRRLEEEGDKPVIWLGDLNVANGAKDTWNEGAKHLAKSAGTTAEERASFEVQLGAGFVDAFRYLHQDGRGHYTYWSQRAGNREPNKGLRLDYFICSRGLMEDGDGKKALVRDSYMVPDVLGSDHCPIVLEFDVIVNSTLL
ncbi:hypothetical protein ACHAW5_006328 [Stephanodiscus triporus]|uniref:DNA-(apurinic or apyrimidinic site) endonuclease n=1 Tax=Stephanodiscus triporus TaxID=2934178 RepID=A0ABD3PVF1_9STRA